MRRLRLALWPAGLLLGIAAEWGAWTDDPGGAALDLVVGLLLIGLGLVAWQRRGRARWAAHGGERVRLVPRQPRRLGAVPAPGAAGSPGRLLPERAASLAAAVGGRGGRLCVCGGLPAGPQRRGDDPVGVGRLRHGAAPLPGGQRAGAPGTGCGAGRRGDGCGCAHPECRRPPGRGGRRPGGAVGLRGRHRAGRGLAVRRSALGPMDAGRDHRPGRGSGRARRCRDLRDRLARALGDPSLVVGYWLPGEGRYVDEAGRPVELPAPVRSVR